MPTPATTAGGTRQTTEDGRRERVAVPVVPFIRASAEHREALFDHQRALSVAGSIDLGNFEVTASGYMRSVLLEVTCTGAAGTPTFHEDFPFSVLQNVALSEPNGATIVQFNSGYELYLVNKWGGYQRNSDPKASPVFSTDAAGNFAFVLRVPVELNQRDGLGALPNQNSAALFKLHLGLASGAANAGVYGATAPTTQGTVRIRGYLEAWEQPETEVAGQQQQDAPPALNTTSFWTVQPFNMNGGPQEQRLTRIGNYIRNLIFVYRRGGTSRANGHADFPDPITVLLDTRPLDAVSRNAFLHQMYERTGFGGKVGTTTPANDAARGLDNGVFVYDFMHEFDGGLGMENRDLWMPTLGSTRLAIQGSFGNAGVLTVLTNDVAVAGSVFI